MKKEYTEIYKRLKLLIVKPEIAWSNLQDEEQGENYILRYYLLPIAILTACIMFLFSLINYTVWQSVGLGFIRLIAIMIGSRLAYLIIREYLSRKLGYPEFRIQSLTFYCATIFCLFQGIGAAIGSNFWGQLFTVFSFISIRTLYYGLNQFTGIKPGQKKNILIIATLSIICMPIIIAQLLMILLQIPAINI